MAALKKFITGLVVGALIGLWVGVNIGKKQPIWSYPFTEESKMLTEKAKEKADTATQDVKKALREKLDDSEDKK